MKRSKNKIFINIIIFLFSLLLILDKNLYLQAKAETNYIETNQIEQEKYRYLSDLEYITTNRWSYNGWTGHSIQTDKNPEGGEIKLIVDGVTRSFKKGMGLHADGQLTYDISKLSNEFPRFIASIGVDASRGTKGSVIFKISVSNDGNTWTEIKTTDVMTGKSPAVDIDLDIKGYKYLRIYVDKNGNNGSDHGVIANAKLATLDYSVTDGLYNKIHKLDYYDNILKEHSVEYNYKNNYHLILERELVRKLGFWTIQDKIQEDKKNLDMIEWILSEDENLEQVIEVGEISNGAKFIDSLSDLYKTYKEDLKTEDGYVYQKMMIGLSASYSTDALHTPMIFGIQANNYDYIERFRLMKKIYDDNLFGSRNYTDNIKEQYKTYHVELMRMIMQEAIRNEEILWLNYQSSLKEKDLYNIQYYVRYRTPIYDRAEYFDLTKKDIYDSKYNLSLYNIPFGTDNIRRYWMAMESGGVCWNQSRFASSLNRINGIPSTGFFQPAHEGYFIYSENEQKQGIWHLMNNLSGWGRSSTKWYGGSRYRLLFDWANKPFADQIENASNHGNSAGYLVLAQANLNDYENYKKSLYYNLLANSYDNPSTKVEIYKKALEIEKLNLDSYDYLIQNYKLLNKTSTDWRALADKIIDAYTYYPNAMHDLLKLIKPYLDNIDKIDIILKEHNALETASVANSNEVLQTQATREIASALLGKDYTPFATFNFEKDENGNVIGKIVVAEVYNQIDIKYSIDGGNTYSKVYNTGVTEESHTIVIPKEEVTKITEENDITINIIPLREPVNIFTIDITKGVLPNNLYANDLENRVVGTNLDMEWRLNENDNWTSYKDKSPLLTGNQTVEIRTSYKGNMIASDSFKYTFTEDNQPEIRKYIPVSHLSIHEFSTQSVDSKRPFYAPNAIDGNINTMWHTDFRYNVLTTGQKPFLIIKLDQTAYISALEFIQRKYKANDPDYIKAMDVYVSMDANTWEKAGRIENLPQNNELRTINFKEALQAQYVKLEMETYNMFASIAMINLYQDTTQNPHPTAGIEYSIKEPTNENVTVRLVNLSSNDIVITNPVDGSNEYIFTEEGRNEFTFEFYRKSDGKTGSATAIVDWIDRTSPVGIIEYSKTTPTNNTVIATLKTNEEVTILNNKEYHINENDKVVDKDGNVLEDYTVDEKGNIKDNNNNIIGNINTFKYEFYENGEFTFEFQDKAGNIGSVTAKVDWIDTKKPIGEVEYTTIEETNSVIATLISNKNVKILNNGGKNTYTFTENGEFTFEFQDEAGNIGVVTAKVNWLNIKPTITNIEYKTPEGKNYVVATLTSNKNIKILNNGGSRTYTFIENGEFTFEYQDDSGNIGTITAKVDWISKKEEKPDNNPTNPENPNNGANDSSVTITTKPNEVETNKPDEIKPEENKPTKPSTNDNKDKINENDNKLDETTEEDIKHNSWVTITIILLAVSMFIITIVLFVKNKKNK